MNYLEEYNFLEERVLNKYQKLIKLLPIDNETIEFKVNENMNLKQIIKLTNNLEKYILSNYEKK